jgi:hypothetical protein
MSTVIPGAHHARTRNDDGLVGGSEMFASAILDRAHGFHRPLVVHIDVGAQLEHAQATVQALDEIRRAPTSSV